MIRCKVCGEPIQWIRTMRGRRMPVDWEPFYYIPDPEGDQTIVLPDGTTVRGWRAGDEAKIYSVGYISHFAHCPGAADMRRGD